MTVRKKQNIEKIMSLIDHLEELRRRVIIGGVTIFFFAVLSYFYVDSIRELFTRPAGNLVFLGLTEAFLTNVKLAFIAGFFISLPLVFHQVWCFLLPGLFKHERRLVLFMTTFSFLFFALGVAFGYLVVLPFSIRFFMGFAREGLQPMLSFSSYISYTLGLLMGFGLVFNMPIVILGLAKIGIVSADFLAKQRMYAVVIIFLLAAFFTPPDVISQILMALPMLLLYEISIFMARFVRRRKKKMVEP